MRVEPNGHESYFIVIDVAAKALGVTVPQARVLAFRYKWRRSPGRPVGYLMADVADTARQRRQAKDDPRRGAKPRHGDTPLPNVNADGA